MTSMAPLDSSDAAGDNPRGAALRDYFTLSGFYAHLAEVAVWTRTEDTRDEHVTFLLRTTDGHWHPIGGSEPAAAELVLWLRQLPGLDTDMLRDLIAQPRPSQTITTLWRGALRA